MYIAVDPYNNAFSDGRHILVFDTSDCTVEAILAKELPELNGEIEIYNMAVTKIGVNAVLRPDILLKRQTYIKSSGDFVTYKDNVLSICGISPITVHYMYDRLRINNIDVLKRKGYCIRYFFLYSGCVVFRCSYSNIRNHGYATAIVFQDGSVEVYAPDTINKARHKAFIVKMETVMGGI